MENEIITNEMVEMNNEVAEVCNKAKVGKIGLILTGAIAAGYAGWKFIKKVRAKKKAKVEDILETDFMEPIEEIEEIK